MSIKGAISRGRLEIKGDISAACIDSIIGYSWVKYVQVSSPILPEGWKRINDLLITKRPDIQIRIYGHYSEVCDLSILNYIPNIENLSVDCLMNATGIEYVEGLKNLKSLSVGIHDLDSFDFLNVLPISIENLSLHSTKSKKPKLDGLLNFPNLKELYLDSQEKNIEIIGDLSLLEKLVLRSVSPKDIRFLRKLKNLWSLDIKLGGIKDLSAIEELENLKYLELWQIRGLSDISAISSLTGLQFLFLQSLRNVVDFPDVGRLKALRRIYLETMKGLTNLDGLFKAPVLEEYIHVCAQNMTPEQYAPLLEIDTLKKALLRFGSDKKNKLIDSMMQKKGIREYSHSPFEFK